MYRRVVQWEACLDGEMQRMASPAGFETTTSPLGGARAIQLCHGDVAAV